MKSLLFGLWALNINITNKSKWVWEEIGGLCDFNASKSPNLNDSMI